VALGSTSIIHFLPSGFDLKSESASDSEAFNSATSDSWSNILQCCAKGFYGIHTIFLCHSSTSHYPSCVAVWTGCPKSGHFCFVPCCVGWGQLFPTSTVRSL
jgi:hypothetical protein